MDYKTTVPNFVLLAILALFGVASFWPLESLWGINHLAFLSTTWVYVYIVVVLLVLWVMFGPLPEDRLDRAVEWIDHILWGGRIGPRLVLTAAFTLVFYLFRVETHFLGDSWGWLGILGRGEGYYHKWTEFGAIHLVRSIQQLLGGYTRHTALVTFQLISILSGTAFVYIAVAIIGELCQRSNVRVLALISLIFGGGLLLFLGYVEFYHLLWATASLFIWVSLRHQRGAKALLLQGVTLGLALLSHLQAAFLVAGPIFVHLVFNRGTKSLRIVILLIAAAGGLAGVGWLISTRLDVQTIFLPLVQGRPGSVDYAVLSLKHLSDLLSQSLLMYPCMAFLTATLLVDRRRLRLDQTDILLGLMSAGSLLFLLVVDPVLGMARDWDLMSLPLLPPVLFLLRRLDRTAILIRTRTILVCLLVSLLMTSSFVAVSAYEPPAVKRFSTLVRHYGAKNRGGWANYVSYLESHGPADEFKTALREMDQLYPEYRLLRKAYTLLDRRDYIGALDISSELVEINPFQADFLQVLANVHGKLGHLDSAEYYYEQAVELKPHHMILNEMGQMYLKRGKHHDALIAFQRARGRAPQESSIGEGLGLAYIYLKEFDAASALADSLFADRPNSPGGHLLKLTISLYLDDHEAARLHYLEFVKHGQGRSDYNRIREHYEYLR